MPFNEVDSGPRVLKKTLGFLELQSLISKGPSHIGERPVEQSASYAVHSG